MKQIIVLGDIELGAGNQTDDFIADNMLSKLIRELARRKNPIDLVLNGDTFDFLKCPYQLNPSRYTRYVTAAIALKKLELVRKAHQKVFNALKKFGHQKNKKIVFVRGNHDLEIAFPDIKENLQIMLGNVHFPGLTYQEDNVYIEHGQQYDLPNFLHQKLLFTKHQGEIILNNTFTSFAIISALIPLKEQHPFFERIKPWPLVLKLHTPIGKKVNRTIAKYMLKSIFYYPLRYHDDPTHMFPRQFIGEFIRRVSTRNWDLGDYLPVFMRKKRQHRIIVLGHIHDTMIEKKQHQVIIRPGAWRDEYELSGDNILHPAKKQYVEITMGKRNAWRVVTLPSKRQTINFYNVVKNENAAVEHAKREENGR
ncbi:hypothetical protein A2819_01305 [Candidatus Azambacteria bacterium RIFCSPHIGHO2_01_FULL_40_24]|uniref:Calcineurin-like phosphoesterase domain-containing protein n=1 Tax=Candidatus Azambacteria bacterium RIFCSPHIGHO2_01_FULL_40_24 TaxID=1797301 RepID=A0A1F5B2Q3_9BACT|nr:MAG: hypothetical protein A2819_01305 [Candidatus Azambacteria bacterium RIFCSPHIGHO2_01_FULL_40_24]HLC74416.1 metallophosphoesterase [Candidatus Nanoarchaeia archaeon]